MQGILVCCAWFFVSGWLAVFSIYVLFCGKVVERNLDDIEVSG